MLRIRTGFLDDDRKPLERGHPAFALFESAWREQGSWTTQEHRDFWEHALPQWPRRRGRRQVSEARALWCRTLRRRGFKDDQIAKALSIDGKTFHREVKYGRGARGHRGQVPAPDAVHSEHVDGPVVNCGAPPLPRVYADDEREPASSYVNMRSSLDLVHERLQARSRGEELPELARHGGFRVLPAPPFRRSGAVHAIDAGVRRWLKENGPFP